MSRYFFQLHNDVEARDDEGRELADLDAARACALNHARDMAAQSVRQGHLNLSHCIEVTDESGATVCEVNFGEAVEITGFSGVVDIRAD